MTPDPGLSFGLYLPLVCAGALYALLLIAAAVLGRRRSDLSERARNAAFVCVLAAGGYAVALVVTATVSKPDVIGDLVYVTVVVVAFFALLVGVLWLVERLVGAIGRRRG